MEELAAKMNLTHVLPHIPYSVGSEVIAETKYPLRSNLREKWFVLDIRTEFTVVGNT